MRYILCILSCLLFLNFSTGLDATINQVKIGNYVINGRANHGKNLILSDGNEYKPFTNKNEAADWPIGATILVLRGRGPNVYSLVNTTTGERSKAKIVRLK